MVHKKLVTLLLFLQLAIAQKTTKPKNNVCKTYDDYLIINTSKNCWYNPDVDADFDDIVKNHGYPLEKYKVTTEDGYILDLYRLPRKDSKKIVFVQHPATADATCWVVIGSKSLGFILWDSGFDVWLGNARGCTLGRDHVKLNPDQLEFWEFSYHEMGLYDISAFLNFIREKTNHKSRIATIGHSMGSTSLLIYASMLPEEAYKTTNLIVAISPGARYNYMKSPFIKFIARLVTKRIVDWGKSIRIGEMAPKYGMIYEVRKNLCKITGLSHLLCTIMDGLISGVTHENDPELEPVIHAKSPSGLSMKTLVHYCQSIASGRFAMYDYGQEQNLEKYEQSYPPDYPTEKVPVPVYIIYGSEDVIDSSRDMEDLYNSLSDIGKKYGKYEVEDFSHYDTLYSRNIKEKIQLPIVRLLNNLSWTNV